MNLYERSKIILKSTFDTHIIILKVNTMGLQSITHQHLKNNDENKCIVKPDYVR